MRKHTKKPKIQTGANIMIDKLLENGVEVIFGYPGGSVIELFDKVANTDIKFIRPYHEQAGFHAAEGYAKASGKPGICMVTSGPGATNIVTGMANAYKDCTPVIAITGQRPTTMRGTNAFQEVPITEICKPVAKACYYISSAAEISDVVDMAFDTAMKGKPGPVLIDFPSDCQKEMGYAYAKESRYKSEESIDLSRLVDDINSARFPVFMLGGGIISSETSQKLMEIIERTDMGCVSTLMGIGSIPTKHRSYLGMCGMHGTPAANNALAASDLILCLGSRITDRVTGNPEVFTRGRKVYQISNAIEDLNPKAATHTIVADLKKVFDNMSMIKARGQDYQVMIRKFKKIQYTKPNDELNGQQIIGQLNNIAGDKTIVTDVGQHQMWVAQHYNFTRARQLITSGGNGTMGFGLPAAIGAHLATGNETYCVSGDGSILMNIQEFKTIARGNYPIKIILMNNGYLGMVRQWQEKFYDKRYAATDLDGEKGGLGTDYIAVAKAFGIPGELITDKRQIVESLVRAKKAPGPYIIDYRIKREDNVVPMIRPGKSIESMMQ